MRLWCEVWEHVCCKITLLLATNSWNYVEIFSPPETEQKILILLKLCGNHTIISYIRSPIGIPQRLFSYSNGIKEFKDDDIWANRGPWGFWDYLWQSYVESNSSTVVLMLSQLFVAFRSYYILKEVQPLCTYLLMYIFIMFWENLIG